MMTTVAANNCGCQQLWLPTTVAANNCGWQQLSRRVDRIDLTSGLKISLPTSQGPLAGLVDDCCQVEPVNTKINQPISW